MYEDAIISRGAFPKLHDREEIRAMSALVDLERASRVLRHRFFDPNVINDTCWLLLQELFSAFLVGSCTRTKELTASTGLPHSTALRYLDHLEKEGFIRRSSDANDSRVTLVQLTSAAKTSMLRFYSELVRKNKQL